jgi:hypothetical protein
MFKIGNFADELSHSMEKNLVSHHTETKFGFDKLAKAVDYLNAAAAVFEKAGMHTQAIEVTEVLRELAAQLASRKTSTFGDK